MLLPTNGVEFPQTPILGAWIRVFKPNAQNIDIFILSKDHQVVFVGGPNTRPTNLRWQTAAILKKNVKSPYLRNRLPTLMNFGTMTEIALLQATDR